MKRVINFLSSKKGGLLMVLLVAAAIPLTVATSLNQQNTRQEARFINRAPPCLIPRSILTQLGTSTTKGYGDLDGDGYVSEFDYNLALRFNVGTSTLTAAQIEAADVNGIRYRLSSATNVSPADTNLIAQYAAGLINIFPVCSVTPTPTPTCRPRPACLDATPRCLMPETSDMCPKATPTYNLRPTPTLIPPVKTYITPTPGGRYSITLNPPIAWCFGTNSTVKLTWTTSGFSTNWFDIFSTSFDSFAVDNNSIGNFWTSGALINNKTYTFRVQNHDWDLTGGTPVQSNSRSITTLNCLNSPTPTPH